MSSQNTKFHDNTVSNLWQETRDSEASTQHNIHLMRLYGESTIKQWTVWCVVWRLCSCHSEDLTVAILPFPLIRNMAARVKQVLLCCDNIKLFTQLTHCVRPHIIYQYLFRLHCWYLVLIITSSLPLYIDSVYTPLHLESKTN
jgi:hypothetical protein